MPEQNETRADVSVVGELNPDLILSGLPLDLPEEQEVLATGFQLTLGSSSAILAHNLSLLGSTVRFTSRVGPDVLGEMCCQRLQEAGVDLRGVVHARSGSNTGVTLILPVNESRRILTFPGAMFEMTIADLDLDYIAAARHFHLSSLFLHRGLSPQIPDLFAEMKRRGLTTSLDTNDDPDGKWGGAFGGVLPFVDILFCNEQELRWMTGESGFEAAAAKMTGRVPLLVVKRGSRGASARGKKLAIDLPALQVTYADSVGAGDTFDAGFLYQWVRKQPLETCIAYGNLAAAYSVTGAGGTEAFRDAAARQRFFDRHWRHGVLVP